MEENQRGKTEEIPSYQEYPGGPFKAGNPGKPKGVKHMTTLLEEAIKKVAEDTGEPEDIAIVKKLIEKAKRGDNKAIEMIWDRLEGRPSQAVDVTTDGEKLQGVVVLPAKEE